MRALLAQLLHLDVLLEAQLLSPAHQPVERVDLGTNLMREVIRGHQRSSGVIIGHQWSS